MLDPFKRRTWDDLAHEFLTQYSFSTVIDTSRRELAALRHGSDETIASFLTRWREKMAQIIVDRPLEREQIQMVVRRLQPRIVRHLIGIPFPDFASLTSALFSVEKGINRGLWPDYSPTDPEGKDSLAYQSSDIYTASSSRQRVTRCRRAMPHSSETYSPYPRHHHMQSVPHRPFILRDLRHTAPQSGYTARLPMSSTTTLHGVRPQQTRISFTPRISRCFSQLDIPLSQVFQRLVDVKLLT